MSNRDKVLKIILNALEALNEELGENEKINISEATLLFGEDASLDSLALVSVIVDVESELVDVFNSRISLTDDEAMSQETSPFSSVSTLTDFIISKLN